MPTPAPIHEPMIVQASVPLSRKVSCGKKHTLALSVDHHVIGWGSNGFGGLGMSDTAAFERLYLKKGL